MRTRHGIDVLTHMSRRNVVRKSTTVSSWKREGAIIVALGTLPTDKHLFHTFLNAGKEKRFQRFTAI